MGLSVVHVVISILRLLHVPCMRDTFPCVCKYVAEPPTNTDSSVFIRILKLITDEKLKNTDD